MTEKIVSYWKNPTEFYEDDGLVFIYGKYNHKNQNTEPEKALGIHWGDYPKSHNVLSPCVIPEKTASIILAGLLHQAIIEKDKDKVANILEAIKYFQDA